MRRLLDTGAKVTEGRFNRLALLGAAAAGHLDIVEMLVHAGADLEARDSNRQTALMRAVNNNHPEVVTFLLTAGAKRDAVDTHGFTAITCAKERGFEEIEKRLVA